MVNISAIFCILAQRNMSRATFLNGNLVIKGMKNALLPLFFFACHEGRKPRIKQKKMCAGAENIGNQPEKFVRNK